MLGRLIVRLGATWNAIGALLVACSRLSFLPLREHIDLGWLAGACGVFAYMMRHTLGVRVLGKVERGLAVLTIVAGRKNFLRLRQVGCVLGIPTILSEAKPLLRGRNIIGLEKVMAFRGLAIAMIGVHLRLMRRIRAFVMVSGRPILKWDVAGLFAVLVMCILVVNLCVVFCRIVLALNPVANELTYIANGVRLSGWKVVFVSKLLHRARSPSNVRFLMMTILLWQLVSAP